MSELRSGVSVNLIRLAQGRFGWTTTIRIGLGHDLGDFGNVSGRVKLPEELQCR